MSVATVGAAIWLAASSLWSPASAGVIWEREYHASTGVMPEDNGAGWTLFNNSTIYQRSFIDNALYLNTMPPGNPSREVDWRNTNGAFDFGKGFVMEARLKVVSATSLYDRWGGAHLYARSGSARTFDIEIDPDRVVLGSIFDFVSFPMVTTDGFHTYRGEALGTTARLYVDDVLRLQIPMNADNAIREFWFGDQGWESGEVYYDFVRYGTLPEPGTAGLLIAAGYPILLRRRRR